MAADCPVCGDVAEHVRRERPREDAASNDPASTESQTTIDVDGLCAGAAERWDRVCHSARIQDADDGPVPILGVYYHHSGDGDDETGPGPEAGT